MKSKKLQIQKPTEILLWVYGVGLAGMLLPFSRELFMMITPLNLLFATLFLFWGRWPAGRVIVTGFFIAIASFFVEALGVNTGRIFGAYSYGRTLGPALLNTPLIIGLNWFLLIYCTNVIGRLLWERLSSGVTGRSGQGPHAEASMSGQGGHAEAGMSGHLPQGKNGWYGQIPESLFVVFAGSVLMVIYDLFLEPAATRLDMWSWECGVIPLRNYLGWFLFSAIFHTIMRIMGEEKLNMRAVPLFAVQLVFFAVIDLFYKFAA